MAHGILRIGRSGLGKTSEATFWEVLAVDPLAVILLAAGPRGCGGGERWVRAAIVHSETDTAEPGWARAAALCAGLCPRMAASVARLTGLDQPQRDSLALTMRAALDDVFPNDVASAV